MSNNQSKPELKPCPKISHSELVEAAEKWLNKRGVHITFAEMRACTSNNESPDVIGWTSMNSVVIECKASRSDFLADKKKLFRSFPERGMGDYRIYFCPPNIIKVEDLPEGWALVYWDGKKEKVIHGIKGYRLSSWAARVPFRGHKESEMDMMLSALRRIQIQGHLTDIYKGLPGRNEPTKHFSNTRTQPQTEKDRN